MNRNIFLSVIPVLLATQGALAADLLFHGGPIHTARDDMPSVEAVVVEDGRIVFAGPLAPAMEMADDGTQVIDLEGAALFPGFTDAHAHLFGIGLREMTLNLEETASIAELRQRLATRIAGAPPGEVVTGRGWIETHWPEGRFPTRTDLDQVSPHNPVLLHRADGHALVANSAALAAAGITRETEPPFGGDILKDENGEPTGMLIDAAMELVATLHADEDSIDRRRVYVEADRVYTSYGWTGIHNMSVAPADALLIERLSDEGVVVLRVYNSVDREGANQLMIDGGWRSKNGRVISYAVKLYMDGALGSRGAALLEPYSDAPGSGLVMMRKEETLPFLEMALRQGLQVNTHAIGDRGNRMVLDWYEEAFTAVPEEERAIAAPRWRVEHAQILDPADIPRFAALGIIPSMQPSHAIGDLHFAPSRLGMDRLEGAYAWKSLIEAGSIIAGGSDAPVERGDPLIEFYAAVARKDLSGFSGEGWHPEEAVDRATALKMFTIWPAYASFAEDTLGTIAAGKRADFSIFSADLMEIPADDIPKARALMTVIDGDIAWRADGF